MYNMIHDTKKHVQLAGTVTIGPKGQVVIPVEVREQMNLQPGDKMIALYMPEKHAVGFMSEESMQVMIDKMGAHFNEFRAFVNDNTKK
jgi:AbrB family looped-hinge helix DNA binding protein